jgi:DUF438 domain-containing protein
VVKGSGQGSKKEVMKDIILNLHRGLTVEAAKDRFEKEIGSVTSTEIAEIEQSLIDDGLATDEIKKFCNVHALLFQSALQQATSQETFPAHPVYLFKQENREVEKRLNSIKEAASKSTSYSFEKLVNKLRELLRDLKGIDLHYVRKEQLLFPFLEKKGFMGPSKVMWGKDNEIRDLMKQSLNEIGKISNMTEFDDYFKSSLNPLMEEISGMIFKEESILFPAAIEKLSPAEWSDILRDSAQIGYVFIPKPADAESLLKEFDAAVEEEPSFEEGNVILPTGSISLKELMLVLNNLPFDLTFVDKDDKAKYFTGGKNRIFHRTRSIIGRQVQLCHPPQSVDRVEKILDAFKKGKKDSEEFWLEFGGKFVYIQYVAIRDRAGKYLGTLEISQDLTRLRKLEGERRLIDEGN